MKGETILLVLHFCCILTTVAAMDCTRQEDLALPISKCFSDQGLELYLPDSAHNRLFFTETWLISSFIQHSSEICLKKEAYQCTITCIMDVISQCTSLENQQTLVGAGDFMALLVAIYCDEELKIKNQIAQNRVSEIVEEERKKQQERHSSRTKYWLWG
ncbi:hypothetical protein BsWGS_24737 [Bradybaena similaris]